MRTIPSGERPRIGRVEANGWRVSVWLDVGDLWISPFKISVGRDRGENFEEWEEPEIHGGNTNNGNAERYRQATRCYEEAVVVAEMLADAVASSKSLFEGYEEVAIRGAVAGIPDFVLAVFLVDHGVDDLRYARGVESSAPGFLDLEGMRMRAAGIVMDERKGKS